MILEGASSYYYNHFIDILIDITFQLIYCSTIDNIEARFQVCP